MGNGEGDSDVYATSNRDDELFLLNVHENHDLHFSLNSRCKYVFSTERLYRSFRPHRGRIARNFTKYLGKSNEQREVPRRKFR